MTSFSAPRRSEPTIGKPDLKVPNATRWIGVAEGAVMIGGLFAIERFALFDFSVLPIHPLVIVVALLAVQYGAMGGIAAALAGTCLALLGGALPARVVGEGYFDYLAAIWSMPLLWLLVAVLLGTVSDNHRRALARARADLEALHRERDLISSQYEVLIERSRRLERLAIGLEKKARHPA